MDPVSKGYSWDYVDSDRCLAEGPCELVFAELDPSGPNADATLYNGTNTNGDKITGIQAKQATNRQFNPKVPIYCTKGIYVDLGSACNGVLVQWRGL